MLTFLGHQLGFATPRAQCLLQEKLDHMRDEGQPAARGPVARGNDSLQQVRKLCKNTLHLVLTLLADPGHRLKARLLTTLTAPLRLEHGLANMQVRDPQACKAYYAELGAGKGGRP